MTLSHAATGPVGDRLRLDGKVAVVTGATSELGLAIARTLGESGARIALAGRRIHDVQARCDALRHDGIEATAFRVDVADVDACGSVVSRIVDDLGGVDVLVNNAGVGTVAPATREDPAQYRRTLEVNLMGAYWMTQACGRVMTPGSAVVMIASILGMTTTSLPQAGYVSSKAGLLGLTRDLARQWTGRKGIRVNAVAPGFLSSGLTEHTPEGFNDDFVATKVPAGRLGEPDEVAAAVLFLASPASSFISGATLAVDGGALIT
ncbi:SDR family NAD(P)-dependent oxidoreductase [Mycobacterium sp. 1274761.0]|uniref:SDR family NAD(P)-dependent oxidoreductase n=1 Tax=Mycobacterium sp. 1274761.0 TaxID=1834077 RepID=UPI0008020176|nr:SDR family oxidoreductase [Mycobacterium sp. 1274761.0]OBK78238.1 short-chain dehydrogenase [Mycobacterium sp. 1274761.0]